MQKKTALIAVGAASIVVAGLGAWLLLRGQANIQYRTAPLLISHFAQWSTQVSPMSILMAFLFSALVGVFFGFYPARKAAFLDPIQALRYE